MRISFREFEKSIFFFPKGKIIVMALIEGFIIFLLFVALVVEKLTMDYKNIFMFSLLSVYFIQLNSTIMIFKICHIIMFDEKNMNKIIIRKIRENANALLLATILIIVFIVFILFETTVFRLRYLPAFIMLVFLECFILILKIYHAMLHLLGIASQNLPIPEDEHD